jgi:hypothetical protein
MRTFMLSILIAGAALSLAGCPDRPKAPETSSEMTQPATPEEAKAQADAVLKEIENL